MGLGFLFQKFLLYGCLGLLLEVFFTGLHSLYTKNWRPTSQTYLWMHPIYGVTALGLEASHADRSPAVAGGGVFVFHSRARVNIKLSMKAWVYRSSWAEIVSEEPTPLTE